MWKAKLLKRILKDLAALLGYTSAVALLFLIMLGHVELSGLSIFSFLFFALSGIAIAAVGGE